MRLVVDDGLQFCVPQHWNAVLSLVIRVNLEVELMQERCAIEWLLCGIFVGWTAVAVEAPALGAFGIRSNNADTNASVIVQSLQM